MSRHPTALALHGSLLAIEGLNGSPGLGALALKSCVALIIPLVLRRVATTHAPNNCVSRLLPDKRLCLMSTSRRGQSSPQKRHKRWRRRREHLLGMHPVPLCRRLRGSMLGLCRFDWPVGDILHNACWPAPQGTLVGSVLLPCRFN